MGVATGGPSPPVAVALRRNRDFQLLWGGQAVSLLGSQISKIAYPLLVLAMTGSPAKAGIAGAAAMLGYLLFPLPAGGLADRLNRKQIMIVCDVIRLVAVGSIAVAGWAAHITYVQVLVAGFIEGSATVFFGLAQRAALPMLVHPSQRSVAVGQNEARQNAAQLAGPALGGWLFGLSWALPFAADAVSYAALLATLPFIRAPMQAAPLGGSGDRRRAGLRAQLREGLSFTWRQPFLRYSAFFAASVNVLLQVVTLGLIVLAGHDGASPAETGVIVGCMGAGGLAGAFVAPWFQRKIPAGLAITGCMWIWALLLAVIAAVRVPLWLCPPVAIIGFVGPSWNVSVQTYRMRITPNELLGRTSSVAMQIAWGVIPLGSLLAGFLLEALSPAAAMTVAAAGMAVTAVAATSLAPIRGAGRDDRPRPPASSAASALVLRGWRAAQVGRAEVGGERRQVEQVEQRVAPPLPRRPVIEVPQALVRRVQDRPQHRALGQPRILGYLAVGSWPRWQLGIRVAFEDRRRLARHAQSERPGQQQPLHCQDAIVVNHPALLRALWPSRLLDSMMPRGTDIPARPRRAASP
jgi:Transmembrane secretion effector